MAAKKRAKKSRLQRLLGSLNVSKRLRLRKAKRAIDKAFEASGKTVNSPEYKRAFANWIEVMAGETKK